MIDIKITIRADEIQFRLDQIPKKLRAALHEKFVRIFETVSQELYRDAPGKFIDPRFIKTGVEDIGSLTIGFIEAENKPGVYSIFPSKGKVLRFISKSGEIVYTPRVLNHPYLKSAPVVARYLETKKPWIVEQLKSAAHEGQL